MEEKKLEELTINELKELAQNHLEEYFGTE